MPFPTRRCLHVTIALCALTVLAACGDRSGKTLDAPVFPPPATEVVVTSVPTTLPAPAEAPFSLVTAWVDGAPVPDRHTCRGAGISPALSWSGVPAGTVELAVTVVDQDAGGFVHWIAYAISPLETGAVEGAPPASALEWPNSSGETAYSPLCPPDGETHRYEFTVHALNQQLEVADDASATELLSALAATSIDRSTVVGLASGGP